MNLDQRHMGMALAEAAKALGLTTPNPPVGAVVARGSRVISAGFHKKAGGPHAEINALANCTPKQLRGATLYITLEPCSSHGRTPPCTQAIIDAGIKRVIYATTDPNPAHAGRADRLLRRAGVEVKRGVLRKEAQQLIRPWAHWITTGTPWVIAKAGSSLDGRLTRPPGEPQWLTSPASRSDAQQLRRRVDAILVGAGTLRADNPSLTVRGKFARGKIQPQRILLAGKKRIDRKNSKLFTDRHANKTIVYKNILLEEVVTKLGQLGITSLLIEGGGKVLGQAFASGLVNEAHFYLAPILCGNATTASLEHPLPKSTQLGDVSIETIGDNIKVSGYPA